MTQSSALRHEEGDLFHALTEEIQGLARLLDRSVTFPQVCHVLVTGVACASLRTYEAEERRDFDALHELWHGEQAGTGVLRRVWDAAPGGVP